MSRTSNEFEIKLSELVKVGIPPLQALTCLEANEATAGDVYLFWHAMIWAIKDVVDDSEFPAGVREQILGILNSRHNQIFGDGNLSTSSDLYLSGAYLNPSMHFLPLLVVNLLIMIQYNIGYLKSDLFRKDSISSTPGSGMEDIVHVSTFKRVTLFLVETAQKEIMYGDKPDLIRWKGRAGDFKKTLLDEMKRYARQQYPFNQQFDENRAIITWWEALQGGEHAQILPVSRTFKFRNLNKKKLTRGLLDSCDQNICRSRQFHA